MTDTDNREQVVPDNGPMLTPGPTVRADDLDPGLKDAVETLCGALKQDMVPFHVQEQIFRSMNAGVQRMLITEMAGLDAGILQTFKQQLTLVDAILRRTFNPDGSVKFGGEDDEIASMDPKDVLNLSLKLSQMMIRDLPKVYSMERIQKMEAALYEVMASQFDAEQQERFLAELEKRKTAV